jgi:inosose dehydratase
MAHLIERRRFVQLGAAGTLTLAAKPTLFASSPSQKFKIGMAATEWFSTDPTPARYWKAVEEIASLGIGATEADNSIAKFEIVYGQDPNAFIDRSKKSGVQLTGVYQALHLHDAGRLSKMQAKIRTLAPFLKRIGADYIALGWDTEPSAGGKPYQRTQQDLERAMKTADELGRISIEEFHLPIAFHAERDIPGPMIVQFLDGTNPVYVRLCADVGHLTAAGLNAVEIVKKHSSRLVASHWKDFDPKLPGPKWAGPNAKGDFVEVGKGIVDFPALAKLYSDINFDGWTLLELDRTRQPSILRSAEQMKDYVSNKLHLQFYPRTR